LENNCINFMWYKSLKLEVSMNEPGSCPLSWFASIFHSWDSVEIYTCPPLENFLSWFHQTNNSILDCTLIYELQLADWAQKILPHIPGPAESSQISCTWNIDTKSVLNIPVSYFHWSELTLCADISIKYLSKLSTKFVCKKVLVCSYLSS